MKKNEPMQKTDLTSLLGSLGFTEKEAIVYVAIQKQGRVAPANLAELTGINRTTVYSVTKELLKKGVIVEDLKTSTRELVATPPEDLAKILDREKEAIEKKRATVAEAVEQLKAIAGEATYPVTGIQFVKEDKLEQFLYDRTPVWDASIVQGDGSYLGFQEEAFVAKYADWIAWYWQWASPKINLQLLSNDSHAERQVAAVGHARREIIFWKQDSKFTCTTWVMGDYVVMFVLSSSPNYLVEIHDARFAENQRVLFKGIIEDIKKR